MTTTDQPMCTPGSLIANVPGILGYHPQDSVVLFLFARDNAYYDSDANSAGGRYELGPILRSDAFDPDAIEGMLIQAKHFYPDLVLATIISENLSIDDAEDFGEQLLDVAYFHHLPLCTVWFVPELYSGAPYYQVGGETEEDLGPLTTGKQEWDQGTISNILAADSMENYRRQGILPASSREESFSFLEDPNPFQNYGDRRRLGADAVQKGEAIVSTIASSDAEEAGRIVDGLLEDWQELLDQITANNHEAGDIMMDDEVLDRAAFYFANTRLRD